MRNSKIFQYKKINNKINNRTTDLAMEDGPKNFQKNPVKLYIQDIFRAKRTPNNKYIYELFGMSFKNIMIQGVVTSIYNKLGSTTNIELSDPTGTIQVYYDSRKHNHNVSTQSLKTLHRDFAQMSQFNNETTNIKMKMLDAICSKKQNPFNFEEGSYINIIGDIFVDDLRDIRMISAYQCTATSIEYDIIWLEELRYLYEKFYLWDKHD